MNPTTRLLLVAALSVFAGAACKAKPDEAPETQKRGEVSNGPDAAAAAARPKADAGRATDDGAAAGAELRVTPLQHASLLLTWKKWVIAVDPVQSALDAAADTVPKADLILITHSHPDHLAPDVIRKLRKKNTVVVMPAAAAKKVDEQIPKTVIASNGYRGAFLEGDVTIEAVPAYNLKRKRKNGEFYHPKGRGNGYVVELGGKRVYVSGDTECTPEMKALKNIDVAFVCMNLPYTMTVEEAAECIGAFEPKRVYPYHYRGQDPSKLRSLLGEDSPVKVVLRDWYPGKDD